MKKKILVLSVVLALVAALVVPMAVLAAANDTNQTATTIKATTIEIRGQDYIEEKTINKIPEV